MSALARKPEEDASLAARLHARIARDGPLTVEAYMQACLSDAASGAYASRQPIGAAGDFTTAPEISQIFGEQLGLWAVALWQSMGEPSRVTVAELGPGRGTLMADALRAWRGLPKFLDCVSLALIETSFVTGVQSAAERADQLSRFATYFGDPTLANDQVARYQRTTAADVSAFARERLGADNRALLLYLPQEEDTAAGEPPHASLAGAGA